MQEEPITSDKAVNGNKEKDVDYAVVLGSKYCQLFIFILVIIGSLVSIFSQLDHDEYYGESYDDLTKELEIQSIKEHMTALDARKKLLKHLERGELDPVIEHFQAKIDEI